MLAHVVSTEGLVAAENAMGIKAGCIVTDLAETIHSHPTLSEILLYPLNPSTCRCMNDDLCASIRLLLIKNFEFHEYRIVSTINKRFAAGGIVFT